MADLDDFLRRAAELRKQKQGAKAQPVRPSQVPVTAEIIDAEIIEPEVIEAEILSDTNISKRSFETHIPKNDRLAREVEQADDKMVSHVKQVFEHNVGHLKGGGKKEKKGGPKRIQPETPSEPKSQNTVPVEQSDLLQMLANPQTVRLAFIASEIFKTKF
ncbi:MAG: hypothetical protein U0905_07445 [Pirellulales bacterium]